MPRRISLLAAAAALTIGAGVLPTASTSAGTVTTDWRLIVNDGPARPVKSAGSACTSAFQPAQSVWKTLLICMPYISSSGATKLHYTYPRIDLATDRICFTNGYLWNGGYTYSPAVCNHITLGGPRIPWSSI